MTDQPTTPPQPVPSYEPGPTIAVAPPWQQGTAPWPPQGAPTAPPRAGGSGMAITALIAGIVGTLFGLVPLTFWIAGPLGVVGLVLALVALGRARREHRSRKLPIAGTVLSALALVLSVVGAVIVFTAVDQLGKDLEKIGNTAAATSAPAAPADDAASSPPVEETTPAPEVVDETFTLGETAEWEDGVTATVKTVKPATFGQYTTEPGPGVKVTVTIKNGSTESIDLFPTADVRLGADGTNAEQVYSDGCDGLSDLGRLAPGRSVTGTLCFSGRGSAVDVSFAPTYDHNALTWTGKVR